MREQRLQHFADHALLGTRQLAELAELVELLLDLRRRPALEVRGAGTPIRPSTLTPSARASSGSIEIGTRRWPLS